MNGIGPALLRERLGRLFGIVLTEHEIDLLFQKYDSDNSGTVDFHEFIIGVMPKDYPSKLWNVERCEMVFRYVVSSEICFCFVFWQR